LHPSNSENRIKPILATLLMSEKPNGRYQMKARTNPALSFRPLSADGSRLSPYHTNHENQNPHHCALPCFREIDPVFVPVGGGCLRLADGIDLRGGYSNLERNIRHRR
jgi:hypothetical protein